MMRYRGGRVSKKRPLGVQKGPLRPTRALIGTFGSCAAPRKVVPGEPKPPRPVMDGFSSQKATELPEPLLSSTPALILLLTRLKLHSAM